MNRILKYELSIKEKQILILPKLSKILRVDDVDGKFFLWAMVDSDILESGETEKRYLEFYKTGQPINTPPEYLNYLGFCKLFIMQELGLYVFENINV